MSQDKRDTYRGGSALEIYCTEEFSIFADRLGVFVVTPEGRVLETDRRNFVHISMGCGEVFPVGGEA